jgi:3-oxoadipate enol-lactonase
MPILTSGAQQIAYTLEGPPDTPVLMLSNSLGTTMDMWQPQAEALAQRFRVLRYDTRGHGGSTAVSTAAEAGAGYTLAQLGGDALRLLDALAIERVHFCGISMGGLTGLWLGVHAPGRLQRLVVANSAACIGTPAGWQERAALVQAQGLHAVADGAAARWFTPSFRQRAPLAVQRLTEGLRHGSPSGYAACCAALAQADLRQAIAAIKLPTLLIASRHDPVTTVADARDMQASIAGSLYAELDASHLSNVEAEEEFTRRLRQFLE